jgi:long-chain fatty acid transport protein
MSITKQRLLTASCAAAFAGLVITAASVPARGAAFQLREGDPDWLANAFAGTAAKAYDAGTAWNNPAGMTYLTGSEIDQALNYFDPGIRFQGADYVNGRPVPGGTGGDAGPPAVTAGMEAVYSTPDPNLKIGMAVEGPFGLRTSYPANFVGRYQGLVSAIEDFQVALSAAYRVTPRLSLGGGPIFSFLQARLTQALNVSAFVPQGGDPVADIHGQAFAAGYHLGGMFQATDALRLGIDYKSRLGYNVQGGQTVSQPASVRANAFISTALDGLSGPATTQVTLPDVLTMSAYYDVSPDWAVMGTVQWTHWSLIQGLVVNVFNQAAQRQLAPESTPIGFNNTWMESIGANWRLPMMPRLMLQAGVLYDQGANTNATRGPRLPDEDRIGTSTGFSYDITPRLRFRAAYLHEFPSGSNHVDYTNNFPQAGTLLGKYVNNADVVSAGVTMKF